MLLNEYLWSHNAGKALHRENSIIIIVCLFVWGISSHLIIFQSYGDVIITGEGLLLTYARHSWPLSSEGSLASRTYGASVNDGHLRGPVTLTPNAKRLAVGLSLPVFTTLICRGWDSTTSPSDSGANCLTHCATATVHPLIMVKMGCIDDRPTEIVITV